MTDQVTVYCDEVVHTTDLAALCRFYDYEVWLPWSQIDPGSEIETVGDSGDVHIPQWLAEEKGLD